MEVAMDSNEMTMPEFEPKKNNLFFVLFPESFGIQKWVVRYVTRPAYDFESQKWGDMELNFIDPIEPSTTKCLFDLIKDFKGKKGKPLFKFNIQSLDPVGTVVEEWEIGVKKVLGVDFGYSCYEDGEVQSITMALRPCRCKLL